MLTFREQLNETLDEWRTSGVRYQEATAENWEDLDLCIVTEIERWIDRADSLPGEGALMQVWLLDLVEHVADYNTYLGDVDTRAVMQLLETFMDRLV